MDKTKVSACIVTHNNECDIVAAIESLLEAASRKTADCGFDFRLYISDNLSSDGTLSLVKEHFGKDARVTILKCNENRGFGAGHNAVLPYIKSDFHIIVNPDIIVSDDNLQKMICFLRENEDIGMLCPKVLNTDGTEQVLPKMNPRFLYLVSRRIPCFKKTEAKYSLRGTELPEVTDVEFCSGCFTVIRTMLFKQLNGFDERFFMYFEDADLTRRVKLTSRAVMYRGAYVMHKWERAGSKSFKFLMIQICSMFKYFRKWRKYK